MQAYGKSKYESELVTQKASKGRDRICRYTHCSVIRSYLDHVILRVPLLYGEVETLDENSVTILFKNIKNATARVKMDEYG